MKSKKGALSEKTLESLRTKQREVASRALVKDGFREPIERVAAVDLAFLPKGSHDRAVAAAVVFSISSEGFEVLKALEIEGELRFPYIPGFLAFREAPLILKALRRLHANFDVLLCDAHGIAHPLGCGCSTYVGVEVGKPTIGVAKGLLCGDYVEPSRVGEWTPVRHSGKIVGAAVLTKPGCRPIFVSPGHLVSVESSAKIVLGLIKGRKLPEPLWKAHELARRGVERRLTEGAWLF